MDSEILKQLIKIGETKNVTYRVGTSSNIVLGNDTPQTEEEISIQQPTNLNETINSIAEKFQPVMDALLKKLTTKIES